MKTFESINPATGEVVGIFPVTTAKEVNEAVVRAQTAADQWSNLSF
jgi:acyl-CoA reductase-like NAD-dependent aldehyde dehydrogenase